MIKGNEIWKAEHRIEPLLLDRWSPRAMSGKEVSRDKRPHSRLLALRDLRLKPTPPSIRLGWSNNYLYGGASSLLPATLYFSALGVGLVSLLMPA
jgi:hypothetical protein